VRKKRKRDGNIKQEKQSLSSKSGETPESPGVWIAAGGIEMAGTVFAFDCITENRTNKTVQSGKRSELL